MKILLLEDDMMIGGALLQNLQARNWQVQWVRRVADLWPWLDSKTHELLLLDFGLPDGDGMEVLGQIRARNMRLPVIILTARDALPQRIHGLQTGADDYITKPFDMDELIARMMAVVRRHQGRASNQLVHGGLSLSLDAHAVEWQGKPVKTSKNEFAILELLMRRPGHICTKEQIEQHIHGLTGEVESNTVEVYVYNLRKKFGADLIQNMRGVGYFLKALP